MEPKEVFDELKTILVTRLKFDPRRAGRTLLALGGLWNPKKCSTSSRRSS